MAEATDAFTGDTENQHTGPQAAEDVQQATEQIQQTQQPETDGEAPDVSEQIQAIRDQQGQILERLPEQQSTEQYDEQLYDMLHGGQQPQFEQPVQPAGAQLSPQELAYYEAVQAAEQQEQLRQQGYQQQYGQQAQEDPRVAQLTEQLSTLREAVIGREEADNQRALDDLASEHSDFLSTRANAEAVRDTVYGIAGEDELLRTDPALVRTAILAAKANAAATANGDPSVSADGGAPVETAAGAAVSQGDDPNDLWAKVFEGEGSQDPFTS